jgi:hypothetical protein
MNDAVTVNRVIRNAYPSLAERAVGTGKPMTLYAGRLLAQNQLI